MANYGGGSVAVLPIGADGKLGETTSLPAAQGSSADQSRQEAPHAHSVNLDAANRFAFVADLGLDQVFVYKYDADKGTLTPNDPPVTARPRLRPAALRVPPRRQARLRHQRDGQHHHRLRL